MLRLPLKYRGAVAGIAALEELLKRFGGLSQLIGLHPGLYRLLVMGADLSHQKILDIEYLEYHAGQIVDAGEAPLDHDLRKWKVVTSSGVLFPVGNVPQRYFTTLEIADHCLPGANNVVSREFILREQHRADFGLGQEGILQKSTFTLQYPPFISEESQILLEVSSTLRGTFGNSHIEHTGQITDGTFIFDLCERNT